MAFRRFFGWVLGGKAADNPVLKQSNSDHNEPGGKMERKKLPKKSPDLKRAPEVVTSPVRKEDSMMICVDSESTWPESSPRNSDHDDLAKNVSDGMIKAIWKSDGSYKLLTEKVVLEDAYPSYGSLDFMRTQIVYESQPYQQQVHKRVFRTRHDPWRRYGPFLKIHEIGGCVYDLGTLSASPRHIAEKKFYKVQRGARVATPKPRSAPIMTEKELLKRPLITAGSSSRRHKDRKRDQEQDNRNPRNNFD